MYYENIFMSEHILSMDIFTKNIFTVKLTITTGLRAARLAVYFLEEFIRDGQTAR